MSNDTGLDQSKIPKRLASSRSRPSSSHQNLSPRSIHSKHSPAQSPTSRSDIERKSFQGDHHRHRFMNYNTNNLSPKSIHQLKNSIHHQVNQKSPSKSPPKSQLKPSTTSNLHSFLGPPSNSHYSPHYGSQNLNSTPTKRKPPPKLNSNEIIKSIKSNLDHQSIKSKSPSSSHSISPSPSPSYHSNQLSPSVSPHSIIKLINSRSPSPIDRHTKLAKKIGSVLSAPFKTSSSRRNSDLSQTQIGLTDLNQNSVLKSSTSNNQLNMLFNNSKEELSEHLPKMPCVANPSPQSNPLPSDHHQIENLTPAEKIIQTSRKSDPIFIVPDSPERVLRVVNGNATTSTKASLKSPDDPSIHSDLQPINTHETLPLNHPQDPSRVSFQSSSIYCFKCTEIDHKLTLEIERSKNLTRNLEEQTIKFEQFRNWTTAKITTMDHALKAQENLLQAFERRMYERTEKPDIKSDYLIALQKDFVELHARLVKLENKQIEGEPSTVPTPSVDPSNFTSHSSSLDGPDSARSFFTKSTSLGSSIPSSREFLDLENHHELEKFPSLKEIQSARAYSSPSPITSDIEIKKSSEMSTPRKPMTWKASSPANMISKLAPPCNSSPLSPNNSKTRSAPATPTSRSPRPRYTSALGVKSVLPINYSPSGLNKTKINSNSDSILKENLSNYQNLPSPIDNLPSTPLTRHSKPWDVLNRTIGQGITNPTSMARSESNNFHSKKLSVINNNQQSFRKLNENGLKSVAIDRQHVTSPLKIDMSRKKPVVGDLIKMFDAK
ncbi:hypothetical protein O181_065518 [Austropuccinia psidii MF-1]|uniref:Uncharacterized protein n=1 Tax=Austropuccinia psidii MF-1 TaxID=1389203 RepID=A0A9Q3I2P2_9BASI|nr:hypothetical protein [Austropuccinia psidii MF-1]